MMSEKRQSPSEACVRDTCEGCEIETTLLCVHRIPDLIDFGILFTGWAIPFFAGMIIGRHWTGLVVWGVLAAIFFTYVEARILCRHCPHYAEDGGTLKCHANYGMPKIPAFDPKPLSRTEQVVWLVYAGILFLFFIPFFILSEQWLLLLISSSATFTWCWTAQRTMCNRCYNLSCPVNRVPEKVRDVFFENYPEFAKAWGKESKEPRE